MNTSELVLTEAHVRAFAAATGDVNPLHVSEQFARRSPYGRPIAHGALVAMVALTSSGAPTRGATGSLTVQFRRPVFPGRHYALSALEERPDGWSLTVTDAGVTAVTIRSGTPPVAASAAAPTVPARGGGRVHWQDRYRLADPDLLRTLLLQWGDAVPDRFLLPMAWASWFTGMVMPGRDALLAQIVAAAVGSPHAELAWETRLTRDHQLWGSVATSTTARSEGGTGTIYVEAFRRAVASAPTRRTVEAALPSSEHLAGRHVLVVGGSRGIGAATSAALASQGAVVHVAYAQSAAQVQELRREFGVDAIRPLQMDARNAQSVAAALDPFVSEEVRLDGVVFSAGPSVQPMPMHPDTAEESLAHVQTALAMAWLPLVHCLPALRTGGGWIVVLSSAWHEEPPPQFAHYVAAKGAIEGMARAVAKHERVPVLVVRPPRVLTDLTSGPGAARGAVTPEDVAAEVVRWVTSTPKSSGVPYILDSITANGSPDHHPDAPGSAGGGVSRQA